MLRPLIEGMQNNIRSQTANPLDPFGFNNGGGGNQSVYSPPSSTYSTTVVAAPAPAVAAASDCRAPQCALHHA